MEEMKLTPQEAILQSEGEAMLRAVQQTQPQKNSILGPDGQPVKEEPVIDQKAAMMKARKEYEEQQKKRLDDLHARMKELTEKDGEALDLASVLLCSHRLIHWAKAELYGRCGAEDDLVEFMDRWMTQASEGERGFTLKKAIADMKHQCLPIAEHFRKVNEAAQGKRMFKLKRILPHLDTYGIALPTEGLSAKMRKCFRLGEVLVLHGEEGAVDKALAAIVLAQSRKIGRIYVLLSGGGTAPELDKVETDNQVFMPGKWWHDSASHIKKLYANLNSFVNDEAALMTIDNLERLLTSVDAPAMQRKQVALVRLYQWARENGAAVVVCNVDPEPADPRFYGNIPYATVKEVDGAVMIDGEALKK